MRLYYMTSEQWGISNLKNRHLKYSRFDDLNDPFELLSAHLGDREARTFYNKLQKAVASRFGVICLSQTWRSPVMWAHYADKHKGLCLGFDVTEAAQVTYKPGRLKHEIDQTLPGVRITADLIQVAMTTKFKEWAYEKEWRVFGDLETRQADRDGHYFQEFGAFLCLREVIIGARCEVVPKHIAKVLGKVDHEVTVKKARAAFQSFEIVRQKRVKPLIVAESLGIHDK